MATLHPFLDDTFHIRWSTLTPDHIVPDITKALAEATDRLDAVCRTDRGRMTFDSTFIAFEEALSPLHEAWGKVSHLDSVCNSPALREAYNEMLPKVSEFFARLYLNESLWDLLKTFSGTPDVAKLTGVRRRFFDETMAEFRANGADLPEDKKKRLEELEAELAKTTQKYSENVLDSTNAWELIIDDESKLAGLPETARAAAAAEAKAKGIGTPEHPAWRFTLKAPSLLPVLEYLDDEETRRKVWEGSAAIGFNGDWDNTALIRRILALRHEKAEILGKANFADLVLERRMARNGGKALSFVEDMHDRITAAFTRQARELQEYKAETLQTRSGPLEPWETAYWSEKRRKAMYDFDEEELRPYFPIDGVLSGMFRLCEKLFGIEIRERAAAFVEPGQECPADAVEVWHPEVKFYEIRNGKGVHLGSFYADWHPRDPKRGGAWMNYLKTGRPPGGEHDRQPHLGLICGNMTPSVDGKPALLSHYEAETVFHEFGHLLHHLLGQVEIKSLNGVNVAWDFVELPSQIMENFCWERKSLDFFARHHETGRPIPPKLFKKMLAAKNYLSAVAAMRQLSFGKMDLELHMHHATAAEGDLDALIDEILKGYQMPLKTKPPAMARRFTHIFGSPVGYAAGYYSYLWAEVLDADCFSRFQREGVLNPKTGESFRDCILSKGNSEPPEKLFRDFMGRDPDLNALLVRNGLS
ncbi:MAG TPA: M3 family metallopeptidase [Verrucomicrobiales bacterium]|nr:M3 family metallopeptidase [Verrucomicrobiales bacterium]